MSAQAENGPSYDALLIIAQSVCGALERAGLTDCDDPGEAIDVMRENLEARVAFLEGERRRLQESAAPQPPAEAQAPTLWCMHIHGPDDVHPAPSKHWAELAAKKFNKRYATISERTGVMAKAVVTEWPHSPESHAEGVGNFLFDWIVPAGQAAEAQAQGGGDVVSASYFLALGLDEYGHHGEAKNVRNGEDLESYRPGLFAIEAALASRTAPPSAPVGVEAERAFFAQDFYEEAREGKKPWPAQQPAACPQCDDDGEVASTDPYAESEPCPACKPARQPAVVDEAMVERVAVAIYAASRGFSADVAQEKWPSVEQKSRFTLPARVALEGGAS